MINPAEIVGDRTSTTLGQRPSLHVVPYVGERTFADPTAQIAVARVDKSTQPKTIVRFPQSPLARKALFRERAQTAINNPFVEILAKFRSGEISLREFGVQRAALIRTANAPKSWK